MTDEKLIRMDMGKLAGDAHSDDAARPVLCLGIESSCDETSAAIVDSKRNILSHIIYNDLNMCKIESRPIPERNWEYHFFVDFEGNLDDSAVKNAIRGIMEEAVNFKILGNY